MHPLHDVDRVAIADLGHGARPEPLPDDGRVLKQSLVIDIQRVDPRGDHPMDT